MPGVVGLNTLARRHTAAGRLSHFAGTEAAILALAESCLSHARPVPNRPGVLRVPVPTANFFSPVVVATDRTPLAAFWTRRADGEDPYIEYAAVGAKKTPAKAVELILYSRDALGNRAATDAAYEVVSVNARPAAGDEPPHPLAMARNELGRPGGTPASYSVADYARAWGYWSRRVFAAAESQVAADALTGPQYPPLVALFQKGDHLAAGAAPTPWVEATTDDWTFVPPPAVPEPPRPSTLARRVRLETPGPPPASGREFAESVDYWSRRPVRLPDDDDTGG